LNTLVVNAGSSTLKLSIVDSDDHARRATTLDGWDGDAGPIRDFAQDDEERVDAVGHRVVHGGTRFTNPVLIDNAVMTQLQALVELAPLHQSRTLAAIDAAQRALPTIEHVGCFDTAFHSSMPDAATTYALPAEWRARWPLRRFGFHGLSHAYASRRASELVQRPLSDLRIVTCHLGAGASLCAIAGGRSIDTTMGFTPLEGLVMATRAGSIDPGIAPWLVEQGGLSLSEVRDALEHRSGLLGLAGTSDMREVIGRGTAGDPAARLAFDVYTHALRRALGGMVAVLLAVDCFVFTGGVGEHASSVRAACGIPIDPDANASTNSDGEISAAGAEVRTLVVTAREDVEIARHVRALLDDS
jgi:acetate kinase